MNDQQLKQQCMFEESFSFEGWDFSHLDGRCYTQPLPWDYQQIVRSYLKPTDHLLDMGTGGGEVLLSFGHPYMLTTVTEAYPPNVTLCQKQLAPRGITVVQTYEDDQLPFDDACFDIVINRHDSFDLSEVNRVLKAGGYFITQQVGAKNNNDLSSKLLREFQPRFPTHTLAHNLIALKKQHFTILQAEEFFPTVRFYDIGALVFFAKIIPWEFPDFSVNSHLDQLRQCQGEIEEKGYVEGTEHRFIIVAKKA